MNSMRDMLDLMEAGRKKPAAQAFPVVNPEKLLGEVMSLTSILTGMGFRFNAEWVNEAIKEVNAKKLSFERQAAEEREQDPESFNPNDWKFDAKGTFRDIIEPIVKRNSREHNIYSEVQTAERVYQDNMNTDPDDLSDFVEASSYLNATAAQRDFGHAVLQVQIGKPSTYQPMLAAIRQILDAFNSFDPNHERIQPEIVESVQTELEHMLPLIRFMLKNAI
ncbi:MAG: hypothetical protein EOP83_21620 [Verrucomicrobiaceae bacterium]|nr:MAG: hypothetical protein EOP83_21620 [Verrucomicrobiaceae bacterium]